LLLIGCLSSAQSPEIDSLKGELVNLPQDTNRLNILMEMSGKLHRINPDTGIVYSQKAIDLAIKLDRKEDLGYALKGFGMSHYFKSDYPEALKYWEASLATFKSINHTLGISNLLNNLGAVYYSQGDNPKGLEYYFESLRFAERINDKERIATAYMNIGAVYAEDNDTWVQARENYAKSLEISREIDAKDAIGTTAINIADLFIQEKKSKEAIPYLDMALEAFEEIGGNLSTVMNLFGDSKIVEKDYLGAIDFYNKGLRDGEDSESDLDIALSYIGLGQANNGLKNYSQAISALKKAEAITLKTKLNNERRDTYEELAKVYASAGQYESAFVYQSKFTELIDTLRSAENEEKLGYLSFQFGLENKEKEIALLNKDNELQANQLESANTFQNFSYALGALLLLIIVGIYFQYRYVQKSHARLAIERNRAEEILLNILPKDTADELKANGRVESRNYKQTTVMFTDFKGFTRVSEKIPGNQLVESIDYYFKKFDDIITKNNLEKIKTIGDSYMCAGGLPTSNKSNPIDAVKASIEIMKFVNETHNNPPEGIYPFEVRIGLNTGPLVAGVVGTKKFQYDIWGNTVNIASRMESSAEEGKINISDNTYQLIKEYFECKYRGEIEVKNAGLQKMYYVEGALPLLGTI
jgi:class 3 adenylate cyclase